jgi:hypothetical protein
MTFIIVTSASGARPTIDKDPSDSAIYGVDFEDRLSDGDLVVSGTVSATGVTLGSAVVYPSPTTSTAGMAVGVRISGGTAGQTVPVTITATTAGGDTLQRTVWLRIVER